MLPDPLSLCSWWNRPGCCCLGQVSSVLTCSARPSLRAVQLLVQVKGCCCLGTAVMEQDKQLISSTAQSLTCSRADPELSVSDSHFSLELVKSLCYPQLGPWSVVVYRIRGWGSVEQVSWALKPSLPWSCNGCVLLTHLRILKLELK